jgi:beta-glucanase (GH16 family)
MNLYLPGSSAEKFKTLGHALRRGLLPSLGLRVVVSMGILMLIDDSPVLARSAKLDLSRYELTFNEEFNELSVSAWGPGTQWIAHTPWAGDFGDAQFADPSPGFPFTVENGILRIESRRGDDGKWRSGLLASTDPNGRGFSQQYGYFEMRAKLPEGPGVWPAFWLVGNTAEDFSVEIDVLEHYGHFPESYESVLHVWYKDGSGRDWGEKHVNQVTPGSLYNEFHTYGVDVDPMWTTFYFDRAKVWEIKTPDEHQKPLFILLNLALGSGWPIDKTPSPSYMYVDYVKAYAR